MNKYKNIRRECNKKVNYQKKKNDLKLKKRKEFNLKLKKESNPKNLMMKMNNENLSVS